MATKQTAVECFYEGLFKQVKASSLYSSNDVTNPEWIISKHRIIELLEFCKQMEKNQIQIAYSEGLTRQLHNVPILSEQYYNETYGSND